MHRNPHIATVHLMSNREFDSDFDRTSRVGGRRWVAPEGRNEFMQPTSWNSSRAALVIAAIVAILVVATAALLIFL